MDPRPPNPFTNPKSSQATYQLGPPPPPYNIFQTTSSWNTTSTQSATAPAQGNVFGKLTGGTGHNPQIFGAAVDNKMMTTNIFSAPKDNNDNPFAKGMDTSSEWVSGARKVSSEVSAFSNKSNLAHSNLTTTTSSAFKEPASNMKMVFGGQLSGSTLDDAGSTGVSPFPKQSNLPYKKLTTMDSSAFKNQESTVKTVFGGQLSGSTFSVGGSKSVFGGNIPLQSFKQQDSINAAETDKNAFKKDFPKVQNLFGGQVSTKSQDPETSMNSAFSGQQTITTHTDNVPKLSNVFGREMLSNIPTVSGTGTQNIFGGQMTTNITTEQKHSLSNVLGGGEQPPANPFMEKSINTESVFRDIPMKSFNEQYTIIPPVFGGKIYSETDKKEANFREPVFSKSSKEQSSDLPKVFGGSLTSNALPATSLQSNLKDDLPLLNIIKEQEKQTLSAFGKQFPPNIFMEQEINVKDSATMPVSIDKTAASTATDIPEVPQSTSTSNVSTYSPVTFSMPDGSLVSQNAVESSFESGVVRNVASSAANADNHTVKPCAPPEIKVETPSTGSGPTGDLNEILSTKSNSARPDPIDEILAVKPQSVSPIKKDPTTLIAIEVPVKCLDRRILTNHFQKFGEVNKLLINPKSKQALIYFTSHASALSAKNTGKRIHPNLPEMKLLFKAPPQASTKDSGARDVTPVERKSMAGPKERPKQTNAKGQQRSKMLRPSAPSITGNRGLTDTVLPISSNDQTTHAHSQTLSMERLTILDSRDKQVRLKQDKVVDVYKAQYLAASCPDMCPEKERYLRHVQNDLSSFETSEGNLDHTLVVKQFSRSSADKEEPLPYELRPGHVLKRTMDFLLCNIVEKINKVASAEVWYSYMWNRTRALRNDLMQQHLVDHNALYVLERCLRFHIHCSHEFCEAPMDMNPKMNDEHLSKSLQSLRELYHDMAELSEFSVSEPEFRGYEILLNLSQGNIFFQYKKFRDSVRNSQPVQFAVQVLCAFHSNNYVKFFKLVQSASYLQGCILHKYYKSVRMRTLQIIVKGYSLSNKSQLLSKDHLRMLLGMCDDSELKEFLAGYGLSVCPQGNTVKINRGGLIVPDSYNIHKDSLISAKRKYPIAEVINGGMLPENPLTHYLPHSSFNEAGLLTDKARTASDQTVQHKYPVFKSPRKSEDDLQKRLLIRTKIIYEMNVMRKYFRGWVQYVQTERIVRRIQSAHVLKLQKKYYLIWRTAAYHSLQLKKQADNFYIRKHFKRWQSYVEIRNDLRKYRGEAITRNKLSLALKYSKCWKAAVVTLKKKRKLAAKRRQFLSRKYIIAWQSIVITSRAMKEAGRFHERNLLSRFFINWRNWIATKQQEREQMNRNYPAIASSLPVDRQNEKWSWGYERAASVNLSALQVSKLRSTINRSLDQSVTSDSDTFFDCLPLSQKFQEHIDNPLFTPRLFNQFIKLRVYISPDLNRNFVTWIRAKFNISRTSSISTIGENVTIYSQKSKSPFTILIAETDHIFDDSDTASQTVAFCSIRDIHRYSSLIRTHKLHNKLLICESSRVDIDSTLWQLSIKSLSSAQICRGLLEKVFDLWRQSCENSKMTLAKCNSAFSETVSTVILGPVQKIIEQRASFGSFKMHPSIVLSMYNEFVDHFASCLQNGTDVIPAEVMAHPYFATISFNNFSETINLLKSLRLPPILIKETLTWQNLLYELSLYCSSLCQEWNDDIKSEIFYILHSIKDNVINEGEMVDAFSIPWADIIFRLISYKMLALDSSAIIYNAELLANFQPSEDYLSYLKIYKAPSYQPPQIEASETCLTNKRQRQSDETEELDIVSKKPKSTLLQQLADESAKLKELECKLQCEIDSVNIDIANFNK